MISQRQPLPTRRLLETRRVSTPLGQTAYIGVGYHPDDPNRAREVFYSQGLRSGSDIEYTVHDVCVLISLTLQCDMRPSEIARSLSRRETELGDITYGSMVGWIVESLRDAPHWADDVTAMGTQPYLPGLEYERGERRA